MDAQAYREQVAALRALIEQQQREVVALRQGLADLRAAAKLSGDTERGSTEG
ncbi:MAG: hypothetical protein ABW186_08110 [Rhodanobacteraceae bacterium]